MQSALPMDRACAAVLRVVLPVTPQVGRFNLVDGFACTEDHIQVDAICLSEFGVR